MDEIKKDILEAVTALKKRLPKNLHSQLLLTGGSAAFLYGSDRPFSHDMDFMLPMDAVGQIEENMKLKFERHTKKPVFHSLKAIYSEGGRSYDLIAESVIEPEEGEFCCNVSLNEQIIARKTVFRISGQTIDLIPAELLVFIKILAGRGQELGKYDLYDAKKILENSPDFDFEFFRELACTFCNAPEKMLPVLKKNAGKTGHVRLLEVLKSLEQCE